MFPGLLQNRFDNAVCRTVDLTIVPRICDAKSEQKSKVSDLKERWKCSTGHVKWVLIVPSCVSAPYSAYVYFEIFSRLVLDYFLTHLWRNMF